MEDNEKFITIADHLERCRMCLKMVTENDVFYKLNDSLKEKFENLTAIELPIINDLSNLICVTCHRDLGKFSKFREEMTRMQILLYELVYGCQESPEEISDNANKPSVEESVEERSVPEAEEYMETEEYLEESIEMDPNWPTDDPHTESQHKLSRVKAHEWTTLMEVSLVHYRNKFKVDSATSDNSVFTKISRIFRNKNLGNISHKSIKYKYEKLEADPQKLKQLNSQADGWQSDGDVEIINDTDATTNRSTRQSSKRNYNLWNEDMELHLLYYMEKFKSQTPTISSNCLYRKIAQQFINDGCDMTFHNIFYQHKKMKRDKGRLAEMFEKVKNMREPPVAWRDPLEVKDDRRSYNHWNNEAEAALLIYKSKLQKQKPPLKPVEIWASIRKHLEEDGYGKFSDHSIKNRYFVLVRNKKRVQQILDEAESSGLSKKMNIRVMPERDLNKRIYLFWTIEMKRALVKNREELMKMRPALPQSELWERLAQRMSAEGYGDFSADNVKYKYFNVMRDKQKVNEFLNTTSESINQE